jgi:hypothetical protein
MAALFGLAFSLCILAQWLWLSPLVAGNILWAVETALAALAAAAIGGLWWGAVARSESDLSERLLSATLIIGALLFLLLANLTQGTGPLGLALLGPRTVAAAAVLGFFMWGAAPTFIPFLAFPERGAGRGLFTIYATGLFSAAAGLLGVSALAQAFPLKQSWIADSAALAALGLAVWIRATRRRPRKGARDPLEDISEISHAVHPPARTEDSGDFSEIQEPPPGEAGGAREPADRDPDIPPAAESGEAGGSAAEASAGTEAGLPRREPKPAVLPGSEAAGSGTVFLAKAMVRADDGPDAGSSEAPPAGKADPLSEALSSALSAPPPEAGDGDAAGMRPEEEASPEEEVRPGKLAASEEKEEEDLKEDETGEAEAEDTAEGEPGGRAGSGTAAREKDLASPRYPRISEAEGEENWEEAEETPLRFWPARSLGYFTFESGRGHELLVYDRACQTLKPASFLGAAGAAGAAALAAAGGFPAAGFPEPWGTAFLIPLALALGTVLLGPALARVASPMTALGLCLIALSLFMAFGPSGGGPGGAWLRLVAPLALLGALWPLAGRVTAGGKGFFPLSLASMNVWILSGATAGIGAFLTLAATRPGESQARVTAYVALAAAFLAAGPSLSWLFTGVLATAIGLLYYFL